MIIAECDVIYIIFIAFVPLQLNNNGLCNLWTATLGDFQGLEPW